MGDVGRGMFVKPGIPEYLRDEVVPRADLDHAQPLRARLPRRTHHHDPRRGARRRRRRTRHRAERRAGHLGAAHRLRRRHPRRRRGLRGRRLGRHDSPAADRPQRLRRRDRRALPRPPHDDRLTRDRTRAHDLVGLRDPRGHPRRRHPRDPADRGAGRDRGTAGAVHGAHAPLGSCRSAAANAAGTTDLLSDCAFCTMDDDSVIARADTCYAISLEPAPDRIEHRHPRQLHVEAPSGPERAGVVRRRDPARRGQGRSSPVSTTPTAGTSGGTSDASEWPDGLPHAHCHLIPRYRDEPYAGRGLRWCVQDRTRTVVASDTEPRERIELSTFTLQE